MQICEENSVRWPEIDGLRAYMTCTSGQHLIVRIIVLCSDSSRFEAHVVDFEMLGLSAATITRECDWLLQLGASALGRLGHADLRDLSRQHFDAWPNTSTNEKSKKKG